jgi:hypothetical protein
VHAYRVDPSTAIYDDIKNAFGTEMESGPELLDLMRIIDTTVATRYNASDPAGHQRLTDGDCPTKADLTRTLQKALIIWSLASPQ